MRKTNINWRECRVARLIFVDLLQFSLFFFKVWILMMTEVSVQRMTRIYCWCIENVLGVSMTKVKAVESATDQSISSHCR